MINQTAAQTAQELKLRDVLGETENLASQSLNLITGMGNTPEPGQPMAMPISFVSEYIDRLSSVNEKLLRLNALLMRL